MTLTARIVSQPQSVVVPTVVPTVATVAGLRGLTGSLASLPNVALTDRQRGGLFVWDTSAAADDSGTRFNAGGLGSSTTGWRRVFSGHFNVRWFGATGDGVTDDTAAIQAAINAAINAGVGLVKQAGTVLFPPGTYKLTAALRCFVENGDQYNFSSVSLIGESDPFSSGASGTFSGAVLVQTDDEQPAIIFQSARVCVVEKLAIVGQNAWAHEYPGNEVETHYDSTWSGDPGYSEPYVKAGCRTNRYSPHAAIVVDPFHDDVNGGDQYPGLSAYYTNTGAGGGSSQIHIRRCQIEKFVCGVLLGANPTTQNVDANLISDTFISECRDCLAIGQTQSRDTRLEGSTLGQCRTAINCLEYGDGNGTFPLVSKGLFGSCRFLAIGAAAGTRGTFYGSYMGETMVSLGHFAGDKITFDSCLFGFFPTPAGFPAYPKVFATSASAPSFVKCDMVTNDGGASRETFWLLNGDFLGGMLAGGDSGASTDPSYAFHVIGFQSEYTLRDIASVSQDSSGRAREGSVFLVRDQEANWGVIDAPRRGGAFVTTTVDQSPKLAWIPSAESGNIQPGTLDVEVFSDGTAEITGGANLDRTFAVGDIVEHLGGSLTDVIEGLAATPVAICLGKVATVSAATVTMRDVPTYVADALSGAGVVARNLIIWPRRRAHEPTTGTVAANSVTGVSAPTYWLTGHRIRDEDGYLGTTNYVASKVTTTLNLAAPSASGVGETAYLYDQPVWDLLRSFRTQQARLFTATTSLGHLNGALVNADVDFQVWTPRASRAATMAAGATDKDSGNGAWVGIGGGGSTHGTYPSKPFLKFGGNSNLELVTCDADGTNETSVGSLSKTGTLRLNEDLRIDADGSNIQWTVSAGSPEGVVTANKGALCSDTTNGRLYVKNSGSGNTGWQIVTQT